jgi:DNA-binding MarR family transcriptional regulator
MAPSDREYLQINQALFCLANAYHSRAVQEQAAPNTSLSVSERGVILVLGQLAPVNLRRLAKALQISSGPVSQYVQKLVSKSLVRKEQDQTDRRNWWLRLTPTGERIYAEAIKSAVASTRDFLNGLDESEQQRFRELLLRISHNLGYDW